MSGSCRGICLRIPKPKSIQWPATGTHYINGHRYCRYCSRWFFAGENRECKCCGVRMRNKARRKH
jgi:hypothetical protein